MRKQNELNVINRQQRSFLSDSPFSNDTNLEKCLHGQFLQWDEVSMAVASERACGKIIVTTNGTFDVFHPGHVQFLQEARVQGGVLFVGLNSDSSIRSIKGSCRPIHDVKARAQVLLSLRCVDYVVVFEETTPIRFIELAQPDVHVNGAEYGSHCVEANIVSQLGARLHLVPRDNNYSSTRLIREVFKTTACVTEPSAENLRLRKRIVAG